MSNWITLSKVIGDRYNAEEGELPPTQAAEINADHIRTYYARRNNAPGSRLTFIDGGGFAVLESPAHVRALIRGETPAPEGTVLLAEPVTTASGPDADEREDTAEENVAPRRRPRSVN